MAFLNKPGQWASDSLQQNSWLKSLWRTLRNLLFPNVIQTASFTCSDGYFYPVDSTSGVITVTLPPASMEVGRQYAIKKVAGGNNVTIAASGSDTIDGAASVTITNTNDGFVLLSNGFTKWYATATKGGTGGSSSPLTTKGDIWGFSTVDARIPVGANTYVLTADSTQALGVKWAPGGTTSPGSPTKSVQYNNSGSFAGDSRLTYDSGTNTLAVAGNLTTLLTAQFNAETNLGNLGTAVTIDWATNGSFQKGTLNNNCTITINSFPGVGRYQLRLVNGGSWTVTWAGTKYNGGRWIGASSAPPVALSSQGTGETIITFFYDGTTATQMLGWVGYSLTTMPYLSLSVSTKTGNYTVLYTDAIIILDATSSNITVTLPAANVSGSGLTPRFAFKRKDSSGNTVTIQRAGSDTLDGGTTYALGALQSADVVSDSISAWYVI